MMFARQEVAMEDGTSFGQIDFETDERFIRLGRELGLTSLGLNAIVLAPGQRLRIHRHARQEEAYIVVRGTLTLSIEEEPHALGVGRAARVAPGVRRQLANLDPTERCVVVAIGGSGEHESRDGEAFTTWDEPSGRPPQEVPLPPDLF
jgi:quercetin dioxygenase-like cupin family protein